MTPLDWLNALLFGASSIYSLIFGLGIALLVLLVPVIFVGSLVRAWLRRP